MTEVMFCGIKTSFQSVSHFQKISRISMQVKKFKSLNMILLERFNLTFIISRLFLGQIQ